MKNLVRELYPKKFWFAFNYGILAGLFIVVAIIAKKPLSIPSPVLMLINFLLVTSAMVLCVYIYRRKNGGIGFTIAREMAFIVYLLAALQLSTFRFLQGYHNKFQPIAVLLGLMMMYGLGRLS
jgi:glucan phosphoethanolaminetransferase (alkaline phosphatase superfamily)